MEKVKVNRFALIEAVQNNKTKHDLIYADAVSGFWGKAETELQKHLGLITDPEKRKNENLYLNLPFPQNHEKEYQQALTELEMSVEDEIILTHSEFSQLVMNDWSWKSSFLLSTTSYVTGSYAVSGCANF